MVTQRLLADGDGNTASDDAELTCAHRDGYGGLTLADGGAHERATVRTSGTFAGLGLGGSHGGHDGLPLPGSLPHGAAPPEHAIGPLASAFSPAEPAPVPALTPRPMAASLTETEGIA